MATDHHKSGACLCKLKKQRRLKVRRSFYGYQLNAYAPEPVGEIQLKGKWLQAAGFTIDTPVTVKVMDGCLVVTAEHTGYDV